MEYNTTASGPWLKVDDSYDGKKVKLINECVKVESRFKDDDGNAKIENQVKAQFDGEEPVNMRLNWTTVYAMVDAFGKDSNQWIGHTLTARVKDATTGQSIYLVPEGFELVRDENKRWAIRRNQNLTSAGTEVPFSDADFPAID